VTYRDLYVEALEDLLNAGGTPATVDKVFAEYNSPTEKGLAIWLTDRVLLCSTCLNVFKAGDAVPKFDEEVKCADHR